MRYRLFNDTAEALNALASAEGWTVFPGSVTIDTCGGGGLRCLLHRLRTGAEERAEAERREQSLRECGHDTPFGECSNPATDPHVCPYKAEINDDETTLCTCCGSCEYECAGDI